MITKGNKTFPLGGIILIEKADKYNFFSEVFKGLEGEMKNLIPLVKLHIYNRLTHSVSVHQIQKVYPEEIMEFLKGDKVSERTLYRTLERLGKFYPIVLDNYHRFLIKYNLVDKTQTIDFSSSYFEGENSDLGDHGYSRDKREDKLQVNFGISTGINTIPIAITIQKGNVQDKEHLRLMLQIISKVIPKNSLLIFDAGANTKANKRKIRDLGYHYLTLRPKNTRTYKELVREFNKKEKTEFELNGKSYYCVKRRIDNQVFYIYFSEELCKLQIKKKEKRFERDKRDGEKLLRKKAKRLPCNKGWVELIPKLQLSLDRVKNPYITGIEGYFILESSIDEDPKKILKLYKERDKAEKFIKALKDGLELRPIRHWTKNSIIGIFLMCFFANFIINLTMNFEEICRVEPNRTKIRQKNVKLLKKYLINLTVTIVYPKNAFKFHVISNIPEFVERYFRDILLKFEDKSLNLRW